MRRFSKVFLHAAIAFVFVLLLSACGSSLQKPTGLENPIGDEETRESEEIAKQEPLEESDTLPEESETDAEEVTQDSVANKEPSEKQQEKPVAPVKKEAPQSSGVTEKAESKPVQKEKTETATPAPGGKGDSQASKPTGNKAPTTVPPAQKPPVQKPPAQKPSTPPVEEQEPEKQADTVVFSIVVSSSEVPLAPVEVEIEKGDTVLDALIRVTKQYKIQMDYRGGQGASAYIEGIANVYEFDRGQGSGWMYRINGIFPDRGAGTIPLLAGDRVDWLYTTDLGEDLNADLQPFRR
ncbi:DUF4430 domain-containing protein [Tetzosporium hominis]|nr:DUF4430 domain-containing protein [Tetzosporium hominis]